MNTSQKLWNDEAGFVVSIELILLASIAVIGLIAGMAAVRDAAVSELSDVAGAVQDVNQSYSYFGVVGHAASTAGSSYLDDTDFCDAPGDNTDAADNCITFDGAATAEGGAITPPTGP